MKNTFRDYIPGLILCNTIFGGSQQPITSPTITNALESITKIRHTSIKQGNVFILNNRNFIEINIIHKGEKPHAALIGQVWINVPEQADVEYITCEIDKGEITITFPLI